MRTNNPNAENRSNERIALPAASPAWLLLAVILAALAGGCGTATEETKTGPDNGIGAATPEATASAVTGPCASEFYPIDTETGKKYKLTSSAGNQELELHQERSGEEGFRETRKFSSGIDVTINWVCTDEGLRMAEYKNLISMKEGTFDMETVQSSGVTIPKSWKEGDEWQSTYDVKVNMKAGPVDAEATGDVRISHKLVAEKEEVEVAAGKFEAARVDSTIEVTMGFRGREIPRSKFDLTVWYAPGIGIVKQVSKGSYGQETIEYAGNVD